MFETQKKKKKKRQIYLILTIKSLDIFQTTSKRMSMKFSVKLCLTIILKVTKNQSFTFSIENALLEKPQGDGS